MKSFFFLIFAVILTIIGFITYGKTQIEETATSLINDAKSSYENVVTEAADVIDEAKAAKDKVEETINDFNNAVEKVEEAKDAISEIAE